MGHDYKGGSEVFRSTSDNIDNLKRHFTYKDGYFGNKGMSSNNHVRNIESDAPLDTARDFYGRATYGGLEEKLGPGKWKTTMEDGTVFVMREISGSSDKSPAVDINVLYSKNSSEMKQQKIHFIKREDSK